MNSATRPESAQSGYRFTSLKDVIEDGIQRQLHTGVQVCVLHNGQTLLNHGFGTADHVQPLHNQMLMPWRSAGKPLTSLLAVMCIDRGLMELTTTLAELLPESRATDKSDITVLQILTHTSGLAGIESGWPSLTWEASVARILASGSMKESATVAYDREAGWFLLAEGIRRCVNRDASYEDVLRSMVLDPLGMHQTYCGLTADQWASWQSLLPALFERRAGALVISEQSQRGWVTRPSAGSGLRGPVSDLARFYEFLRKKGSPAAGIQLLPPHQIDCMTRPHRHNQYDATLQHRVDFGLGVIVDPEHHNPETVPYGFGLGSSVGTFGHGGAQCAMGFCDPQHQLVVCWAANAYCGEGHHLRRNYAINTAIYRDLGLLLNRVET